MTYRNLQEFISALRQQGDLVEVAAPVDARLEIAEIHRRVIAAGGPALLFTNVIGKHFPVVTNLFGTQSRVEQAFGPRPKQLVARIAHAADELLPPSPRKLWGLRDLVPVMTRLGSRRQRRAPVLAQRIPGADLTQLPALTSWIEDGGPFLTLPLVHTRPPGGGPDNLGMYRIQIHDARETGLHCQIGKGGGFHLHAAEQLGVPLPVNIYLGGPPALILAAVAPLPENIPELLLAALVMGKKLGRGKVSDPSAIDPVAEAEFCLVGAAPPGVRRPEGPFGDHYGYYSLKHDYPVFRPTSIYHRDGAVFPATIVGKPRQEDFFIGDYLQELLLPLIPKAMPAVRDLWSYGETGYHALAAAVVQERYGREALTAAFRILGEGQLALTKFLMVTDRPLDLRNFRLVLTHILERVRWEHDLFFFAQTAMDTLDYTGPAVNQGSKGLIMGLGEARRTLPREFRGPLPPGVTEARVFAPGCLVLATASYASDRDLPARLVGRDEWSGWQMLVVVDDAAKATATEAAFLWTTFTRFDPAADVHAARQSCVGHRVSYQGPILIDARMKPTYPDALVCDPDTAALVTRRWREYFPDAKVRMGDSTDGHLYLP